MVNKILYIAFLFLIVSCSDSSDQFGGYNDPRAFEGISISDPEGVQLPIDSENYFEGKMSKLFGNKLPKLFILGYYECPMLCNSVRDNLFLELSKTDLLLGSDYEIIMMTIDPDEKKEVAISDRDNYFARYFEKEDNQKDKKFINFMTATSNEITEITNLIGFEYKYDPELDQYFHPSFVYIVSDKGLITSGFQIGPISEIIEGELDKARKNKPSMNFDQFYNFTCMQKDIQNKNPKKAFELLQFSGIWFLSSLGFGFIYKYLLNREGEK